MKDNVKRLLAFVLAAVMLVSLCPTLGVSAATAEPEAEAAQGETSNSYEPWKHGYRLVDVLNWSPETDNYGEELRARVPLQERNEPFTATQANPNLKSEAQVYNVAMGNYRSTDTAEAPWNGGQYYDDFSYNLFKFWQYTDYIGAGGRPTTGFDAVTAKDRSGMSMASSASPSPPSSTPLTKTVSRPLPSTSSPETPSTPKSGCTRMKTASSPMPRRWWRLPDITALTATSSTRRAPSILLSSPCSRR